MNRPRHRTRLLALIPAALALAVTAPPALADSSLSSNWSGYAVHRGGVSFRKVTATWREPSAACRAGSPSFSAIWVGLGGFSLSSGALEQIGTEVDCSKSGSVVSSAWYELVPSPSMPVHLTPKPGDTMQASVSVAGHRVTLRLIDRTRHKSFVRTVSVAKADLGSAEWIVEAPSQCTNLDCRTLPLADFGSVPFASASAVTAAGRRGSISSRRWSATKITLALDARHYVSARAPAAATPSGLQKSGAAFSVAFAPVSGGPGQPAFSPRRASATSAAARRR
ncbi:MAG: G1 family endopeptidase [Actinomycetota bacterium]|nr:G1 family endopeptidase [Actinomycetota bacterium]